MLPISDECDYGYPDVPTHLATNVEAHDNKLPYPQYFGGVVLINREDFEQANGYSNEYWGYGFQDLDLLYRLQKSGAYLEKFYDTNRTFSNYDELDVLPYRIEKVQVTNNSKTQEINCFDFDNKSYLYGPLNMVMNKVFSDSFTISLWFNDDSKREGNKNLFVFEGCDTGIFLSKGNQIISQIWNDSEEHFEISTSYARNKWNHVVFSYDKQYNKIYLFLNNKKFEKELKENFKIYDYQNHCIKISDNKSSIKIGNIINYDSSVTPEIVNKLYFNGLKSLDLLKNKHGITPINRFNFQKLYRNEFILDDGKFLNHLPLIGNYNNFNQTIYLTDEIYIPYRLQGEYKSLTHSNDKNIIERYYEFNPDVEENADIFFHDVLTNTLKYTEIGLNTVKYKLLDKQNKDDYELIRIVT